MVIALAAFTLWINVSPSVSLHPELEYALWTRALKVLIVVLASLFILKQRDQIDKLTLVLALSVGFFGIKGGLFTLTTGGEYRVWGPASSFIEDNNAMAVATIMVVPVFRYLQLHWPNRRARWAFLVAIPLCLVSAIGSYSRGALIALAAMGGFLALRSKHKLVIGIALAAAVVAVPFLMPDQWFTRMGTIETYDTDTSAQGRINAWRMTWNLAKDRFPIGGGFAIYEPDVFSRYAPNPTDIHAAHSIYFQVLGEHGFVGLALFLLVFILAWRAGSTIIRDTRNIDELVWARDFAIMMQASGIAFAVGGAFLSLAYFDFPYYLAAMLVIMREIVDRELERRRAGARTPPATRATGPSQQGPAQIANRRPEGPHAAPSAQAKPR